MHLTHYDTAWVKNKHREKRFDRVLAFSLLHDMARAGLDTLILDVEDAVRYRTHPELRRAYSAPMSDYRRIVVLAGRLGIAVVPKLNFAKGVDLHNAWMSPYDEIPDIHPRYVEHALQIVDELTDGLPIRHVHIGMDEDDRPADLYLRVILQLRGELAKRRLRTVMWADIGHMWAPPRHLKTKAILARVPRDVILMPWTYDRRSQKRWVSLMAGMGFTVWGGTGPDPDNMRMWADDIRAAAGHGLVATLWKPLDAAHARAHRRIVRNAGRHFPGGAGERCI